MFEARYINGIIMITMENMSYSILDFGEASRCYNLNIKNPRNILFILAHQEEKECHNNVVVEKICQTRDLNWLIM